MTWTVNALSLHLFAIVFLVSAVRAVLRKERDSRGGVPFLAVFFGFSLLLALFYSLGDGAHPNSRYSIIVDVSWLLAFVFLARFPLKRGVADV